MVFLWAPPKKTSPFFSLFLDDWLAGWFAHKWGALLFCCCVYNFSFSLRSAEHETNISQSNTIKIRPVYTCLCASSVCVCVFLYRQTFTLPKDPKLSKKERAKNDKEWKSDRERYVKRKWEKLSIFHVAIPYSLLS